MTFEIRKAINSLPDVLSRPKVNSIVTSPLNTALLSSIVVLIIILVIFSSYIKKDTNYTRLLVRTTAYIYIANLVIMLIHNYAVEKKYESRAVSQEQKLIVGNGDDFLDGDDNVLIVPAPGYDGMSPSNVQQSFDPLA